MHLDGRPRALCRRAGAPSSCSFLSSRCTCLAVRPSNPAAAELVILRSTTFDKTSIRCSSRSLIRTSPNPQSLLCARRRGDWQGKCRGDIPTTLPDQDILTQLLQAKVA